MSQRRNSVLGILDQATSSATNLGINVIIAGVGTSKVFGAWGVVYALYLLEVALLRGAVGSPYTVRLGASRDVRDRSEAIGTVISLSLAAGVLQLLAAAVIGGAVGTFLVLYTVCAAGLLVQEIARMILYAHNQAKRALESNLIWATAQIVGSTIVLALDGDARGYILAWAAGGWVAALYCLRCLGVRPWPHGTREWFREHGTLAGSWSADQVAQTGLSQILVWTMGIAAGLSEVAAYRGAVVLTGPATVVLGGLSLVLLPAAVRRERADSKSLKRFVGNVTPLLGAVSFVLLVPLLVMPDSVGRFLLDETWESTSRILPLVVAARVLNTMIQGPAVGLRALEDRHRQLWLRLIGGVATLVGATAAAAVWGAGGVAAVLLAVAVVQVPAWQIVFHSSMKTRPKHLRRYTARMRTSA